ncbi:RagB/SusD family nutrient uptake outer membrane protein [Spongiivirga citrea]|uniref:RagB/SusD family nutrient uptake outer membrane protein n=1 Tax=Spongiivirga citrea TaxID=1481457 RepID=A0A6M0CLC5_9FLAO|nr:RagB/SusD family nutrient uptake outer membrane protein [Spongiivirga citrea]NER18681.1 RagB/SusD family nutrient uptake outer membrane protein [Spongiivirga citrea]
MKKYSFYLIASLFVFLSCEDAREIDPTDLIDSNQAFGTVGDIEQGVQAAYGSYTPENVIAFSSRFVDDLRIGSNSGGQGIPDLSQVLDPGSGSTTGIWTTNYSVINLATQVILAIEAFETDDESERVRLNRALGEMLALRSLAHIDLMALYSSDNNIAPGGEFAADALAVPYVNSIIVFEQPVRNTVAEFSAAVIADLDRASSVLGNQTDINRVTPEFITAARARLALYTGDNTGAIANANSLIADIPLADKADYLGIFRDTNDEEVIWSLIRNQAAGGSPGGLFAFGTRNPFLEVSFGLGDLLDPMDARREVVIDLVTSESGETRVGKYFGRPGEDLRNNVKVFRVAEQYLIKAEAQARSNDLSGAAATIDLLRDARFGSDQPTPSYGSLRDAIEDILLERRLELAYEGHRYIDFRRTRDILGNGIVRDSRDCGAQGIPCGIPVDDRRFAMPIPNVEIAGNTAIIQNPGYGN